MAAPDPSIRLVTVFETDDPGVAALAKSILEDAGIDHFVRGDSLRNVLGWGAGGAFFAAAPAAFQVREEDSQHAANLLSQLSSPTGP